MSINKIKSFAKLNLALNVIGKKASLHSIETIVAFISLHDEILISEVKSKFHIIKFSGKFSKNIGKKNTVSKLIEILEKKKFLKDKKFKIEINKKIPTKSGLGGGSMNAASILRYFLKRGIITVRKKDIFTVSKLVGSDVILGLNYSNSILTAKNKIRYFYNCKKFYTLIVRPNFGCSTKQIYSQVKRFDKSKFNNPQKKMFNLDYLKKMNNSLETIVLNKHAKLRKIKIFLENLPNTVFVRMTGSGSSLVAYFKSKKSCDIAMRQFNKKYRNYWCTVAKTI